MAPKTPSDLAHRPLQPHFSLLSPFYSILHSHGFIFPSTTGHFQISVPIIFHSFWSMCPSPLCHWCESLLQYPALATLLLSSSRLPLRLVRDNHLLHCDTLQLDQSLLQASRTMSYNFRSLSVSLCRLWIPRKELWLLGKDSGKLTSLFA